MPNKNMIDVEVSPSAQRQSQRYFRIIQRRTNKVIKIRRPTHDPGLLDCIDILTESRIG